MRELNAVLFPWASPSELDSSGVSPRPLIPQEDANAAVHADGVALTQAALMPTFLDRRAFWRCILPKELLEAAKRDGAAHDACGAAATSAVAGALGLGNTELWDEPRGSEQAEQEGGGVAIGRAACRESSLACRYDSCYVPCVSGR